MVSDQTEAQKNAIAQAYKNMQMTIFQVLVTMRIADAVLKIHFRNIQVSRS